jgi:hypothetical protein
MHVNKCDHLDDLVCNSQRSSISLRSDQELTLQPIFAEDEETQSAARAFFGGGGINFALAPEP